MMEIWNILDENGNKTGKTMIRGVDKLPDGFYHESVAVWIINSENRLLIQKRASTKKRYPNMWAMTTGAMNANENRNQAIIREIKEELGIDIEENELIYTGMQKGNTAFINSFIVKKDIDLSEITLQKEEVSKAEWDSYEEVEKKYNNAEFVPHWWEYIKNDIKKYFN